MNTLVLDVRKQCYAPVFSIMFSTSTRRNNRKRKGELYWEKDPIASLVARYKSGDPELNSYDAVAAAITKAVGQRVSPVWVSSHSRC